MARVWDEFDGPEDMHLALLAVEQGVKPAIMRLDVDLEGDRPDKRRASCATWILLTRAAAHRGVPESCVHEMVQAVYEVAVPEKRAIRARPLGRAEREQP